MEKIKLFLFFALVGMVTTSVFGQKSITEPIYQVVLISEVKWDHLNPARGDLAPKAATLWGDRKGIESTGFLLKPTDGFQSPPHIHNVSYRAVVTNGLIHNDDPNAEKMWLPSGSFWTQPKGEIHITAAKGTNSLAYVEIEEGPYLVLPSEEKFDSGERPVNIDKSNMVWLDASDINWINQKGISKTVNQPKIAFLWGNTEDDQLNGSFVKLPVGFKGKIHSHGASLRAVIIKGNIHHQIPGKVGLNNLEPGSFFSSEGKAVHNISNESGGESIIYVRSVGKFEVVRVEK